MAPNPAAVVHLAAESRDSHLTLRRVERQQRLVELLGAVREPVSSAVLARRLGVGLRTVERDLARLRESGVPIESMPGPSGGHLLPRTAVPNPVSLTFEEVAALIASLAALGPTSTHSADSAMRALVQAIAPDAAEAGEDRQPNRHVLKTTSESDTRPQDHRAVTSIGTSPVGRRVT
jgi:predicted DNA-binding transcriptional regulator YafY